MGYPVLSSDSGHGGLCAGVVPGHDLELAQGGGAAGWQGTADVDEAVTLLEQYDMHASMGMMIHFAISDANGKSIAVEYIDNKMVVTETPVLTNFYISQGEKYGIGTNQSHERYDILMKALSDNSNMNAEQVKNALDSVSKDNFNEYESTEWSIVFNQTSGEVIYYHRENYDNGYIFNVKDGD